MVGTSSAEMRDGPVALKTRITTGRFADTQDFYERVFGLEVIEAWDSPGDRGVILGLPGGRREALLEVWAGEPPESFAGLSLQWKVSDIAVFRSALPKDVESEGPTERPWGSTYLYLRDPNDIQVIVYSGNW